MHEISNKQCYQQKNKTLITFSCLHDLDVTLTTLYSLKQLFAILRGFKHIFIFFIHKHPIDISCISVVSRTSVFASENVKMDVLYILLLARSHYAHWETETLPLDKLKKCFRYLELKT